jgi:hypothetical protein
MTREEKEMPPVEVSLNGSGTRWMAELRGRPETRAFGRTVGEAAHRARRIALELHVTGRLSSSSRIEVA